MYKNSKTQIIFFSTTAVFKVNSESNQLVDSLAGNGSIYIVGRVDDRKSRCSKLDKKITVHCCPNCKSRKNSNYNLSN